MFANIRKSKVLSRKIWEDIFFKKNLPNVTSIYCQQTTKNLAETVRSSSFCLHKLIHDKKTHPWDLPPVYYSSTSFQIYLAKLCLNHLTSGNVVHQERCSGRHQGGPRQSAGGGEKERCEKNSWGHAVRNNAGSWGRLHVDIWNLWRPLTSHIVVDEPKNKATSYFGVFGVRFTSNYGRLNWENDDCQLRFCCMLLFSPTLVDHPDLTQCTHLRAQFQWQVDVLALGDMSQLLDIITMVLPLYPFEQCSKPLLVDD